MNRVEIPTGSNAVLMLATFLMNFAISERFLASICVSIALFLAGKLLDWFVKPMVEEWRAKRKGRS
jgi:NhaP-type Na+/H+ and K+/H+ antiporter